MGEYRDGKWVPTFGDDQFGVCDSPAMRAENAARTEEFIEKMKDRIRALEAELAKRTPPTSSEFITMSRDVGGYPIATVDEVLTWYAQLIASDTELEEWAIEQIEHLGILVSAIERLKAELAELESFLIDWSHEAGWATGHGDTLLDILREMKWQQEEGLAEAKKDSERLEWWFRHISSHYITYHHLMERWVVVKVRDMKNCSEWQDSERTATDAARAAEDNADE